jgi:hypothetical protein
MATPTLTSELDAINIMLSCIGEAPVASVDTSISEVEMAKQKLDQVLLEVTARGKQFNREIEYTLTPDENGEITLPAGTLWVDVTKYEDNNYVQRGTKLYDRLNHTYTINKSVKADLHLALDFIDLPFAARLYIALRAARQFQADVQGSETVYRFSAKSEDDAEKAFEALDAEAEDANVLNSNYHAYNILRRYRNYGGN